MLTVADLAVAFSAEGVSQVNKAIDTVDRKVRDVGKGFSSTLDSMADHATRVGGILSVALTAPLLAIGKNAVTAASDLNEAMSAVETVFGSASGAITSFANDSATQLGISEQAALSAAGQLGALFSSLGVQKAQAADFSTQLLETASDLGSFYNVDPGEAFMALRSGLIGEAEPLRRFGILISAAAVDQKALEMGLAATSEELTEQDKVLARYELILDQVGAAGGDFLRTSDGLANSQRILSSELTNLSAEFGEVLLPYAQEGVKIVRQLVSWFSKLAKPTKTLIVGFAAGAAALGPLLLGLGGILKAASFLGPALALLTGPLGLIIAALGGLYLAYQTNFLGFADGVRGALGWLQDAFSGASDMVGGFVDDFQSLTAQGFNPVEAALRSFNGILRGLGLGDFSDELRGIIDAGRGVGDWVLNTAVPAFQQLGNRLLPLLGIAGRIAEAFGRGGLGAAFEELQRSLPNIGGILGGLAGDIGNWFLTTAIPAAWTFGQRILGDVWQGIRDNAPRVWGWFTTDFLPGIGAWLGDRKDDILTIGGDILGTIWEGIKSAAPDVWDWFRNDLLGGVARNIMTWWADASPHIAYAWDQFKLKLKSHWDTRVVPWLESLPDTIRELVGKAFERLGEFKDWALEVGIPKAGEGITLAANFATDLITRLVSLIEGIWTSPDAGTLAAAHALGERIGRDLGQFVADGLVAIFTSGDAFKQTSAADYDATGLFGAGGIVPGEELGRAMADSINMDDVANGFFKSFEDAFGQAMADRNIAQIAWDWLQEDLSKGPGGSNNQMTPGPIFDWLGGITGLAPQTASAAEMMPPPADTVPDQATVAALTSQLQATVLAAMATASADQTLLTAITTFSQGIVTKITGGVASATEQWTGFQSVLRTMLTGTIGTITADQTILDQIAMIGTTVAQHAGTRIGQHTINFTFAVRAMADAGIQMGVQTVTSLAPNIGIATVTNAGVQMGGMVGGFADAIKAVVGAAILQAEAYAEEQAGFIGGAIVTGATIGLTVAAPVLDEAVRGMAQGAIGTAATELEAESPSKVFRRLFYSGPQGAALGIADGMPLIESALTSGLSDVIGSLKAFQGDQTPGAIVDVALALEQMAQSGQFSLETVEGLILALKSFGGENTPASIVDAARELESLFFGGQNITPSFASAGADAGAAFSSGLDRGSGRDKETMAERFARVASFLDRPGGSRDLASQAATQAEQIGTSFTSSLATSLTRGMPAVESALTSGLDSLIANPSALGPLQAQFNDIVSSLYDATRSLDKSHMTNWYGSLGDFIDNFSQANVYAMDPEIISRYAHEIQELGDIFGNPVFYQFHDQLEAIADQMTTTGTDAGTAFGTSFTQAAQGAMGGFGETLALDAEQQIVEHFGSGFSENAFGAIESGLGFLIDKALSSMTSGTHPSWFTSSGKDPYASGSGDWAKWGARMEEDAARAISDLVGGVESALEQQVPGLQEAMGESAGKIGSYFFQILTGGPFAEEYWSDLQALLSDSQEAAVTSALAELVDYARMMEEAGSTMGTAVGTGFNSGLSSTMQMPSMAMPSTGPAPSSSEALVSRPIAGAGPGGTYASSGSSTAMVSSQQSAHDGSSTPFNPVDDADWMQSSKQSARQQSEAGRQMREASDGMRRSVSDFRQAVADLLSGEGVSVNVYLDGQQISADVTRHMTRQLRKGFEGRPS